MNNSTLIPHLLVVDDNAVHMVALSNALMDTGEYQVTAVGSAQEGLKLLRLQQFDLVLTDLRMPEMDGIEFLRLARQFDNDLVGVVMTGHGAIDTAIEAMKAGALDYVLKPFKLSTIVPVLKRGLEVRQLRKEVAQLQQRVREHVVELESANQELEAFSYTVSHDLRAPLRVISGMSTVLVQSYAPQMPGEARQLVNRISTSVDHMSYLIDHLLRFASLSRQPVARQPVDVAEIVLEVLEMLRQTDGYERVKVTVGDLPMAPADGMLLRQVFSNLLSNAFKFTRLQKDPRVEIGCINDGNENIYFVRDNGAGFDMSQAGQLFKVFHRLHSRAQFEGTGVGLAFVQRIVQRHGGRIWAEAEVNKGAAFYFTLGSGQTINDNQALTTTMRSSA